MVMENGRIVGDVEVKVVGEGDKQRKVLNNRLAIRINNDQTTFIDFTAWGSTADFIGTHFTKGDGICLIGKLMNKPGKKDNVEFTTIYLLVDEVQFPLSKKKDQ